MALHRQTGVVIFEDILKRIGPEAAFIVSLNHGLIPDVGFVCESDDAKRIERSTLKMLSKVPWKRGTGIERTRLGGVDAHVVKIFHPRMSDVPIAPTFGVVDGHFLATLYPISFQRFVATKRRERKSIESNRDYAALRSRVPADALSLSYLDVRRGVEIAYDTMMPVLQAMPQTEGGMPIYEFPEAGVFTKHLYGRIAWRVADERGMHWYSHSSTDVGSILMGFAAATGGVVALTIRRDEMVKSRPPPQVVGGKQSEVYLCEANVRRIRTQLRPYLRSGKPFAASLDQIKSRWLDRKTMTVPGSGGKRYTYYGPDGRNGILLAGAPNGPDGQVCILTTNLRVARISPAQLRSKLAER
jgi:hypothetical protein